MTESLKGTSNRIVVNQGNNEMWTSLDSAQCMVAANIQPSALTLRLEGEERVRIDMDGTVVLNPKYTLDENSQAFYNQIASMIGHDYRRQKDMERTIASLEASIKDSEYKAYRAGLERSQWQDMYENILKHVTTYETLKPQVMYVDTESDPNIMKHLLCHKVEVDGTPWFDPRKDRVSITHGIKDITQEVTKQINNPPQQDSVAFDEAMKVLK